MKAFITTHDNETTPSREMEQFYSRVFGGRLEGGNVSYGITRDEDFEKQFESNLMGGAIKDKVVLNFIRNKWNGHQGRVGSEIVDRTCEFKFTFQSISNPEGQSIDELLKQKITKFATYLPQDIDGIRLKVAKRYFKIDE